MVKAAVNVTSVLDAFVERLQKKLGIERVILSDIEAEGVDGPPSTIRVIVVSPAFEALDWGKRTLKMLGSRKAEVSPLIEAFPYTPDEFAGHFDGRRYDGILAQFLVGSREVYVQADATPLHVLREQRRGEK